LKCRFLYCWLSNGGKKPDEFLRKKSCVDNYIQIALIIIIIIIVVVVVVRISVLLQKHKISEFAITFDMS
jgi:hypothetical protein